MPNNLTRNTKSFLRYLLAVVAVVAAFFLREGFMRLVGASLPPYITFYPSVMVVALLAGVGPGLLATTLAALATDFWILAPEGSFAIASLADAVGLALFSGMGVFMSVVAELYRRARQRAAAHDTELLVREGPDASPRPSGQNWLLNVGFVASLAILVVVGWYSVQNMRAVAEADARQTHTYVVIQQLDRLLSALKDAETGQRGFLLTGEDKYLEPYQTALGLVQANLSSLKQLTRDNPSHQQDLAALESLIQAKTAELKQTIELRRAQGLPAALQVVATDKGETLMDQIRQHVAEAQAEEQRLLQQRTTTKSLDAGKTLQALLAGGLLSFLLMIAVFLFLKQENTRRTQAEAEVRHHRNHLQDRVAARTEELNQANARLKDEIEEHQQAKEALRLQREWLQVTLTSIGDAVLATDTAGRITFLNPVAASLTGWQEDRALGQPVQDVFRIINEQTHAPGEDIVARVLREGQTVALANHTALLTRDGREIPIEDSAAPIRDSGGTVSGVVLVFHDVTQKRRDQEALRESERQFRTLADSIPNLAWWANGDGYLTWYNRRWYEYTGTTPKQMEGWGWQSVHDPQALPAVLERWKASIATGEPFDMTFPLRGADGVFRPFLTRVMPLKDAQGRVQQWFGTNTDVSDQKRAEAAHARLAAIVESSDDAILAEDLDGNITSWNAGAERLFGYRPNEVIGRSILLLLPPERQAEEAQIMARLHAGERVDYSETTRLTKDGRSLAVSITISPLKNPEGRIIGASKILQDITERKRADTELRRQTDALRARNEELTRFNQAAVGRELRMIELKHEINDLCVKLGQPPAYSVDFAKESPPPSQIHS